MNMKLSIQANGRDMYSIFKRELGKLQLEVCENL